MYITFTTRLILRLYTDGRKDVIEEAEGQQHNITEAPPNEVKLGEVG